MVADRYGRKNTLIAGNILASVIIAVFALTTNPVLLLVSAFLEGISEAAFSASSGALIAEKAQAYQRSSVFSLYGFAQSIAYGIGSIAIPGVVVFQLLGFSNQTSHALLFIFVAALSLASTVILFKITEAKREKLRPETTLQQKVAHKKSQKILAKYVLASAILAFGAGMVVPLMTKWFELQYRISDTVSGPVLGVTSLFIGFATLAAPVIAKKIGLVKAIAVTQAFSTFFMFATPLPANFAIASSIYTVRAFLMNMASPLSQSMIMGLVDEDVRGVASGINAALWRLPNALSTLIGASMMGAGLLMLPFFIASALYGLSITLFWYFFRKTKMPEEMLPNFTERL
jgi:MFS family permease